NWLPLARRGRFLAYFSWTESHEVERDGPAPLGARRAFFSPRRRADTRTSGGNMTAALKGARLALLVTQGFDQVELTGPRGRRRQAGAEPRTVSLEKDGGRAWHRAEWGDSFPGDDPSDGADPARFDALVLPGGVMNPAYLRLDHRAVDFARHFMEAGKPVA